MCHKVIKDSPWGESFMTFKFQPRSQARSSLRELRARDLIFMT